ncbi:hypothetical protein LXA43DRAFT_1064226 [Ganoderma leucocontextum]|nr:hypothetical protein LXA43DRAFT_1064226 [Ganoderma leucocontextum]
MTGKSKKTKKAKKLIERPHGQVGRNKAKGGMGNLRDAMFLTNRREIYKSMLVVKRASRTFVEIHLDSRRCYRDQNPQKVAGVCQLMANKFPVLERFEGIWPVRCMIETYLNNSKNRIKKPRDSKSREESSSSESSSSSSDSESSEDEQGSAMWHTSAKGSETEDSIAPNSNDKTKGKSKKDAGKARPRGANGSNTQSKVAVHHKATIKQSKPAKTSTTATAVLAHGHSPPRERLMLRIPVPKARRRPSKSSSSSSPSASSSSSSEEDEPDINPAGSEQEDEPADEQDDEPENEPEGEQEEESEDEHGGGPGGEQEDESEPDPEDKRPHEEDEPSRQKESTSSKAKGKAREQRLQSIELPSPLRGPASPVPRIATLRPPSCVPPAEDFNYHEFLEELEEEERDEKKQFNLKTTICPQPGCADPIPTTPSAKLQQLLSDRQKDILRLTDRRKDIRIQAEAKLRELNYAIHTTIELTALVNMARRSEWPELFDAASLSNSVISSRKLLVDMIAWRPQEFSFMWKFLEDTFEGGIARIAKLFEVNATNMALSPVYEATRVGYYGEQGEAIILSALDLLIHPRTVCNSSTSESPDGINCLPLPLPAFKRFILAPSFVLSKLQMDHHLPSLDASYTFMARSSNYGYARFLLYSEEDDTQANGMATATDRVLKANRAKLRALEDPKKLRTVRVKAPQASSSSNPPVPAPKKRPTEHAPQASTSSKPLAARVTRASTRATAQGAMAGQDQAEVPRPDVPSHQRQEKGLRSTSSVMWITQCPKSRRELGEGPWVMSRKPQDQMSSSTCQCQREEAQTAATRLDNGHHVPLTVLQVFTWPGLRVSLWQLVHTLEQ